MHCERSVAKAISKIKGVETFMTDMPRQRVAVKGRINPEKVVQKIKKKTGKRVEILINEEGDDTHSDKEDGDSALQETSEQLQIQQPLLLDPCWDSEIYTMFSDENPNACSTM
ncbi:unnamed protein product [Coffea canephora]|uniref:HMA domain-containing protein n=1 Tax=Coffea canephora TaxID=49390 RepID=A0A068TRI4_COFCA|nr:unnamed protein product [Coffea canephora]